MLQTHSSFDDLLATASDLAITVVTGQLGPPMAGRMWIGGHALDAILCPDRSERQVAILIAPGGPAVPYDSIYSGVRARGRFSGLIQRSTSQKETSK